MNPPNTRYWLACLAIVVLALIVVAMLFYFDDDQPGVLAPDPFDAVEWLPVADWPEDS